MTTYFRHDLRVVPCDTCGAPLEGTTQGGAVECRYCRARQDLTPREDRRLEVGARLPEAERLALLRRQDAFPTPVPATLDGLVFGDRLVPWKVPEALARWQLARRSLASGSNRAAGEELFALTHALVLHYERQGALLEARALAEGALDELGAPKQRQVLRAFLARAAALEGDAHAAEAWLDSCDASSSDLESDGAYRLARACIDTVRGDFSRVLQVLGAGPTEVALPNAIDPAGALLRANAWERLGQPERGAELLAHLAEHGGPMFHLAARELMQRYPALGLCQQSARLAEPRVAAAFQARAASPVSRASGCFAMVGVALVVGTFGAFLLVMATVFGVAGVDELPLASVIASGGAITLFVLTFVAMMGVAFALLGSMDVRQARAAEELRRSGRLLPGVVVQRVATGNETMGNPELAVRVLVLDGASGYLASTDLYLQDPETPALARGALVALRVAPDDPHTFALVL